ncbi:MAG: flavin reductase family protein [Lactobacillales bacterium]|jgi:flavin reductase (DIM6/NTAB) family NADH-FMN oxidoreductase RutF|nr:flavin reductase family protein [Lactobacillales bacterium]
MIHFSANELHPMQAYKFLTGSIVPRPIAWVTTQNTDGSVINAAPFSFFNIIAPGFISLSILSGGNGPKDTARNILETGEAVIHIVNDKNVLEMNQTAASLPPQLSEIDLTGIETTESKHVAVPAIKNAPIRFEAKLHQHIPVTTQGYVVSDLLILEITDYYFDKEVFNEDKQYIIPEKLKPVARLAGMTYADLGKLYDIERPF